jgi:SAM-dependent methyltransferase
MAVTTDFDVLKDKHRRIWASGDYSAVTGYIAHVGPDLVRRLGIGPGRRLLDVATGTGLVAIPAARAGADVTGLDLTPELLDRARAAAAHEGLNVTWVEGDAEALPFGDASFGCVTSTFGVQFAPRHDIAAGELVRVCGPDGLLGLCNWKPDSYTANLLTTVGRHMPPPPAGASPPPRWGDRAHVEELLGDAFELRFEAGFADFTSETAASFVDSFATIYGPLATARRTLEPAGRWAALREELVELTAAFDRGGDRLCARSEYLIVLGRRRRDI